MALMLWLVWQHDDGDCVLLVPLQVMWCVRRVA
jgi:hypothetical protein